MNAPLIGHPTSAWHYKLDCGFIYNSLPDSVDDHEHLAEHLEDVGEGQEGDVGVAVRAQDVDRERERLQRVEQVPLRQHHSLRNACMYEVWSRMVKCCTPKLHN